MRDFRVHYSFYSEEWGSFDDVSYPVSAESPFEAREKAWALCDEDKETVFRSNIRQYAVTWTPNPLDSGDYFYSHAADIKQTWGNLEYVTIPNDRINGSNRQEQINGEKYACFSAMQTLNTVAKDLYGDRGILPPSVYEELHYAEKLCEHLGWGEKADALWDRMDRAKKWDWGAIYSLRDLFRDGYTILCGETELFKKHFGRSGIYPFHNNPEDNNYAYIRRWQNQHKVERLARLPLLDEKSVITDSKGNMDYICQYLVLDGSLLNGGYRKPEHMIWQVTATEEYDKSLGDGMLLAENPITGQCMTIHRDSFIGVLRPDILATLDLEPLNKEYADIQKDCDVANFRNKALGDIEPVEEDELDR